MEKFGKKLKNNAVPILLILFILVVAFLWFRRIWIEYSLYTIFE